MRQAVCSKTDERLGGQRRDVVSRQVRATTIADETDWHEHMERNEALDQQGRHHAHD